MLQVLVMISGDVDMCGNFHDGELTGLHEFVNQHRFACLRRLGKPALIGWKEIP